MDDKKLNTFVVVSRSGSFTKASEELYMSPTAIMRQMDALEKELGADMFFRTKAGCVLTEQGKVLYDRARIILREMEETARQIHDMTISKKSLTICSGTTYSMITIDQFSASFAQKHPDITIQYIAEDIRQWFQSVRNKKADCAFQIRPLIEMNCGDDLIYTPVIKSRLAGVVNLNHPYAKKKSLTLDDFTGQNVYMNKETDRHFYDEIAKRGARTNQSNTSPSSSEVFNICQKQYIYITIDVMTPQYRPLVEIPIEGFEVECGFVTRKKMSPLVKEYIENAKTVQIKR